MLTPWSCAGRGSGSRVTDVGTGKQWSKAAQPPGAALSPGSTGGSGTWSASPASGSVAPGACSVGRCLGPAAVLAEPLVWVPAVPQLSPEMDVFGGAPRFLAYPRTFTVQSGADAILKCQIAGDPRPSIIWEKDKSPIALLGRFQVEAEGNVYSLLISQVTPEDSGQYICKAKNTIGETYAAATLKVEAGELQQEGDPEDVPPAFLSKPLSWQVCRGEDVVFTCRVSGQPCPMLQWEKDGRQLSDLFESSHFSVGREPEDWHFLKIFSARPPDGGVYVCRAQNRSGEALAAAVLLVDPMARGLPDGPFLGSPRTCWPLSHFSKPPDQHGDRRHCHGQLSAPWPARPNGEVPPSAPKAKAFAVSEGKHAKLRCHVTGKPKPEIVWKKDGQVVAPDRRHLVYEDREGYFILKVLYCKARDQGLYICTASNTAGQTLSAVQLHVREHRVRFQMQLEDVEVQECEDAVLECKVPLETIPTSWYLEDKQLQSSHKYVIEEQGLVRRLTIRDARTDDDGIYLCEMKDKGRSIAEVSVRGAIVKRLPRKLDVMEGENAAFCVETREAVEGICWSRNGLELRETPCTVLKSFGKTHLLVLVHVTREDAGVISFSVGESQTSAQLRVKCAKRVPPSAPVAAEMSTDRSNAALLTWCPGPDVHRSPPSSYVLERQEASTAEWVQCLTTDLASMVEVLGDSVPAEADYCFRICAVNKYGRSRPVEFPGSVHLVPVACVRRALKDVQVQVGQDAQFSLELSASVAGNWFLNGAKLQEEEEGQSYCIKRSGTEHSLLLRSVRLAESGAEVTFVSSGVRDSATLRVQAPQVCIAPVPEAHRLRELLAGLPLLLECEVSTPDAPVRWLKDGEVVPSDDVVTLQAEGCARRLCIRSARPSDAGTYTCDAGEDALSFTVTVTEPPVRIVSSNEDATHTYLASERVVLACELSRADGPVQWYKDGVEVEEGDCLLLEREGPHRRLVIPSARPQDTGEFVCDAGGDSVFYNIMVTEPPVRIVSSNEDAAHTYLASERVVLACELSHADGPVQWYKDGVEVEEGEHLLLEREGPHRRLVIPSARPQDTGEFVCDAGGDSVFYNITVTEPPVRIVSSNEDAAHTYLASERVVLACELSRADGPVQWYKDGVEVEEGDCLLLEREGPHRRLVIPSARPQDTGEFVCDAGGDSVFYNITVTEPPVRIVSSNEDATHTYLASERVVLACELSRADGPVQWYKDGVEVEEGDCLLLEREGPHRRLVIPSARPQDTGEFVCDAGGDSVFYNITVTEPPVRILHPQERSLELRALVLQRLELRCELSSADAQVCWFKDGLEVDETENLLLRAEGAQRWLIVPQARAEDAGEYICETRDESVSFDIRVSEPPVKILQPRRAPPTLKAVLGETVTLACELSRGNMPVQWVKDGTRLEAGGSLILEEEGAHRRLVIPAAGVEHSGKYVCDAADDTRTFTVQVCDPPVTILGRGELQTHRCCLAAEDLVLEVTLSHAHGEVKWYKDGEKLQDTGRVRLEEDGARRALVILGMESKDAGEYLCDSHDDSLIFCVTVEVPRVVEIISELLNRTVLEGDDATFKCLVSPDDVALTWQLNGQAVTPCERLVVTRNGLCHALTIRQCQLGDAATVTACAEGLVSTARLSVQEAQVLFVRKLQDVVAEELQDALLEVELSREAGEVQWLKQGVLIQPGCKYQLQEAGCRRGLTIRSLSPSDRGTYRCESLHDRTQAKLRVEPRKVSVRKPLSDVETFEKETATFQLELSHADVPGMWTRDGIRVKPSRTCRVSAAGCVHSLRLLGLTLEDSGTVTFTADTLRSNARLTVREPPVAMVKAPRDVGVPETGAASFECELSRPVAEVKWYKDGTALRAGPKCRIYSVGRRRFLQLSHCSLDDAGEYTCDAGGCRASATLRVYERQVQIVQELADVLVRENENAVFTCQVSHEDVKGEWFRGGEKIKVTSTVKIRQEGPRHFLLICNVRPEDAGCIRFVAKAAASEASLQVEALPVRIVKPLRDKTALVRHKATLECTVSQARGRVRWFRGDTEIFASDKYEICSLDGSRTLIIHRVGPEDEASYTCDAFDDRCTARLLVEGH
ncbi:obscurin-like protein 1 [Eretmochelys imbricata]